MLTFLIVSAKVIRKEFINFLFYGTNNHYQIFLSYKYLINMP